MNTGPTTSKRLADIWGASLKARRTETLQASQDALAELSGVTQQTISNIEAGKVLPRPETQFALAKATGTTVAKLFPWPAMDEVVLEDAA